MRETEEKVKFCCVEQTSTNLVEKEDTEYCILQSNSLRNSM